MLKNALTIGFNDALASPWKQADSKREFRSFEGNETRVPRLN